MLEKQKSFFEEYLNKEIVVEYQVGDNPAFQRGILTRILREDNGTWIELTRNNNPFFINTKEIIKVREVRID